MNEKAYYWVGLSDYDLETARAMLETKRLLYVGFMCHQCIEMIIKAYHSQHLESASSYSHSLSGLARKAGIVDVLSEQQWALIDILEPLNIEARYPSYKEKLLKVLNFDRCTELINETSELQSWIKAKL